MIKSSLLATALTAAAGLAFAEEKVAKLHCTIVEGNDTAVLQIDLHSQVMHLDSDPSEILRQDAVFLMSQNSNGFWSVTYLFNRVTGELVISGLAPTCFVPDEGASCAINTVGSRWLCNPAF